MLSAGQSLVPRHVDLYELAPQKLHMALLDQDVDDEPHAHSPSRVFGIGSF